MAGYQYQRGYSSDYRSRDQHSQWNHDSNFGGDQDGGRYGVPRGTNPHYPYAYPYQIHGGPGPGTYQSHGDEHGNYGSCFSNGQAFPSDQRNGEDFDRLNPSPNFDGRRAGNGDHSAHERSYQPRDRVAEEFHRLNSPIIVDGYAAPWGENYVPCPQPPSPRYHHEQRSSSDQFGRSGAGRMGQGPARGGNTNTARSLSQPVARQGIQKRRHRGGPRGGRRGQYRRHQGGRHPNPNAGDEDEGLEAVDGTSPQRARSDSIYAGAVARSQPSQISTTTDANVGQVLSADESLAIANELIEVQRKLTEISRRLLSSMAAQSVHPSQDAPDANSPWTEGPTLPTQERERVIKPEENLEDN